MTSQITFKLPDLFAMCEAAKLTSSVNPRYKEAGAESAAWISSYKLLGPDTRAFFDNLNSAIFVGCTYPYAGYNELKMSCDYLNLIFILEEITDVQSGADVRKTMDIHFRVLSGEPCDGSALSRMSFDFRANFLKQFGTNNIDRFLSQHKSYADAVIVEADHRDKSALLCLDDYVFSRRENSSMRPCFTLIECCNYFHLPDEALEHPTIKRMHDATLDMLCWSNDVYSYNVEQARDRDACFNVIPVIMKDKAYTLQEAVDYTGAHIQALLSQFIADKAALPSFGTAVDANLQKYINGLETWVTGNLRYSFTTPRYFGDDREEVEKTLIVKLAERRAL
ncbi:terpenoid synthase [Phellopilus nigrolimitatus]|nr:terpenoid synthase [Phellopilus nigrolimitatus]